MKLIQLLILVFSLNACSNDNSPTAKHEVNQLDKEEQYRQAEEARDEEYLAMVAKG